MIFDLPTPPHLVRLRRLSPHATEPTFGTPDSACFDIYACLRDREKVRVFSVKNQVMERPLMTTDTGNHAIMLRPGERLMMPTGWAVEVPQRTPHSLRIYSRSGLALKQGLIVVNGVGMVDADYRHEVFVLMSNISGCASAIVHGDRIAQGEFVAQQTPVKFSMVDATDDEWFTTTRTGGFGSTGV